MVRTWDFEEKEKRNPAASVRVRVAPRAKNPSGKKIELDFLQSVKVREGGRAVKADDSSPAEKHVRSSGASFMGSNPIPRNIFEGAL